VGSVVISQVYGAGGNVGAAYKNDFIELYNGGAVAVNLMGWSVQYASATGTSWAVTSLTGSIPPGGYYLVRQASGGAVGLDLPTENVAGNINMSGTAGKVALTNTTVALSGGCPVGGSIVDFVGFGATANCFEGAGPTPAPAQTISAIRKGFGCSDTANNAADFVASPVNPRNSASGVPMNESDAPAEADYCTLASPATLSVTAGQSTATVLGVLYEAGTTEAMGGAANVIAQVGYGPLTSNPENQPGWQWFNAAFTQQGGTFGNDDEYGASFTAPASPGSYAYAFRFAVDGPAGQKWTYCDLNGAGSNPGLFFDLNQVGALTVLP
jgi:hypothetical protein